MRERYIAESKQKRTCVINKEEREREWEGGREEGEREGRGRGEVGGESSEHLSKSNKQTSNTSTKEEQTSITEQVSKWN